MAKITGSHSSYLQHGLSRSYITTLAQAITEATGIVKDLWGSVLREYEPLLYLWEIACATSIYQIHGCSRELHATAVLV